VLDEKKYKCQKKKKIDSPAAFYIGNIIMEGMKNKKE
jgi:hypothetical protein